MPKLTLENLGRKLEQKRGGLGVRATAAEIGISPATLSRVERGKMPDLMTFKKICKWLNIDPGEVLGVLQGKSSKINTNVSIHFRKKREVDPQTAEALAQMIMAAQRAYFASEE